MTVTCRIDTSNWAKAQDILYRGTSSFAKKTPGEALAYAVGFVVKTAKDLTPVADIGRIDTELAVMTSPRMLGKSMIGTRNLLRPSKNKKLQHDKVTLLNRPSGKGAFPEIPLVWLIIGARAKAGSNWNRRTSSRWLIGGGVHPYKGKSVDMFRTIMADAVARMVKSRHSATHFLKTSWNESLSALAVFCHPRDQGRLRTWAGKSGAIGPGDKSSAFMSGQGTNSVTLTIQNRIGMRGQYPALDEHRNEALHRMLGPVLQMAIDTDLHKKIKIAAENGLLDRASALERVGVYVRI